MSIESIRQPNDLASIEKSHTVSEGPKTMSVPEAGKRYFNLAKNASYEAARRGELPVIKIGSRLRVPVVALERMLERAGTKVAHGPRS
jgi:Helix-turn-helix domain